MTGVQTCALPIYTLSYTLKDAQGNAIQPKNNDGVDTTLGTEIQF